MKSTGWVNISNEDCKGLHYKFQEEKGNFHSQESTEVL
jgi:hypothetical protein